MSAELPLVHLKCKVLYLAVFYTRLYALITHDPDSSGNFEYKNLSNI